MTVCGYTVYMHIAPNGKKYVGITCRDVSQRWGKDGNGYKGSRYFWCAINKYGWDNIVHQVVATGLTEDDAKQSEKQLIRINQTRDPLHGYNLTEGGDGICGFHHTEESRDRMSAAHKGYVPTAETRAKLSEKGKGRVPTEQARVKMAAAQTGNQKWFGRKHTDETRAKMCAAQKGRTFSDETKKKMSASASARTASLETRGKMSAILAGNQRTLGYKHTDETRAKMSAAQKGNQHGLGVKHTVEARKKMRNAHHVNDIECLTMGGEVVGRYVSLKEAEEKTGVRNQNIWGVCAGRTKSAGGFKWRYAPMSTREGVVSDG